MHGVVDLDHPSVFDMPRPRANRPSVTSPVALPAGWSMVEAPGGRPFYRNNLSGVTQWHPPPLALPPGWVEQTTPDGTSFFLNTLTKVTAYLPLTHGHTNAHHDQTHDPDQHTQCTVLALSLGKFGEGNVQMSCPT